MAMKMGMAEGRAQGEFFEIATDADGAYVLSTMKKPTKTPYRVRNWREYNAALVNRGSLTFWIDEKVAETWVNTELSGGKGASNYYSDTAITTVLMLKEVFHMR